jgi:phage FluMu gp28-like protein
MTHLPNHESEGLPARGARANKDATGKTAAERFEAIRKEFLDLLGASGHARTELYCRPRTGEKAQLPTELEQVRSWAAHLEFSVNDIAIGIQRAFQHAAASGHIVTSFSYCVPQIVARLNELRESRTGAGPQFNRGQS